MGKTLYLECSSGISGDMTVAALLDLGADQEKLKKVLASLPVEGFRINISRVVKSGIDACDFDVVLDHENHDHDMEYLHGSRHVHGDGHSHENGNVHGDEYLHESGNVHECGNVHGDEHLHEHPHESGNMHEYAHMHGIVHAHESGHMHGDEHMQEEKRADAHTHTHAHVHRGMKEITEIICQGDMTEAARSLALKIFSILAKAEAKAHNVPEDEVHFHEVGAVDSIVDVISAAVCLDDLNITEVIVPSLCEGQGTVRCQHGILPIPVPAVTNIVAQNHLHLTITQVQGELVTPTGAAIAAAIRTSDQLPRRFSIEKTGIGAGKRTYECPGILRAMLITPETAVSPKEPETEKKLAYTPETAAASTEASTVENTDTICKLESNIDDCSGEVLGYLMERLFAAGAKDAHYQPVFMKKNRPAWLLTVLCEEANRREMERIIFHETTTIGIRRTYMERTVLKRELTTVSTPHGEIQVKVCRDGSHTYFYPEYESVAAAARETGASFDEISRAVIQTAQTILLPSTK